MITRPSGLTVAVSPIQASVTPPPQIEVFGTAGCASSNRAPVALKSQAEICALPRSVVKAAGPKRAAVSGRGATVEQSGDAAPGPPCMPAKASPAETAGYVYLVPSAQLASAVCGPLSGQGARIENLPHRAASL